MKTAILALLFCVILHPLHAADEALIPASLNAILPKIHARMTVPEVEAALSSAYPKVKGEGGKWSGQTGYINYKLDERFTLSVSSITRDGKEVVHDELLLYLYDYPAKRRLDLKVYDWEKQADKNPNQTAAQSGKQASEPGKQAPESDKPSAEDMALVKGLIVKGTVKQAIGQFGGFSRLQVGATFELDLSNLPKETIKFTRPPANPGQPSDGGYIPLQAPLEIVKVKNAEGHVSIDLSSNETYGKFLIQIVADLPTDKGTSAYLTFYRIGENGLIGERSMAEARGELKMKDLVSSDALPKANEPATQPADANEPKADASSKGLEFLADIPSLKAVSLKMSEAEFFDIVTKQKLNFEKNISGETTSYLVHAMKGAKVNFGFQQGKCTGIQRLRD